MSNPGAAHGDSARRISFDDRSGVPFDVADGGATDRVLDELTLPAVHEV